MLTSKKVINAINEQIGYEFSASMQYYAIAAHFAAEALPQLSQYFFQQAEEEKGHALRFIKYVVDAGGRVMIPAIDAPKSNFKTPKDAVKLSLDQEVKVTKQINALVELARNENDYITINFLQWFLTEQRGEPQGDVRVDDVLDAFRFGRQQSPRAIGKIEWTFGRAARNAEARGFPAEVFVERFDAIFDGTSTHSHPECVNAEQAANDNNH